MDGFLKNDSGNLCGIFRRPRLFSMTPDDTPDHTKTHPSNPSFLALVLFASRVADRLVEPIHHQRHLHQRARLNAVTDVPWLVLHAGLIVALGGLLELEFLLMLGGVAAYLGDVPLGVMLVLGFQGNALGEPLFISLGLRRHHQAVINGARWTRRLGLTRRIVTRRGALMQWIFVVYNLLGSAGLSVAFLGGGYMLAAALAAVGVDVGQHVPALASSLGALAILEWMRHHARVQRLNQ